MKKKIVSFRCEEVLDANIRKLAKSLDLSVSEVIEGSILAGAYAFGKRKREEKAIEKERITSINSIALPVDNKDV